MTHKTKTLTRWADFIRSSEDLTAAQAAKALEIAAKVLDAATDKQVYDAIQSQRASDVIEQMAGVDVIVRTGKIPGGAHRAVSAASEAIIEAIVGAK